METGGIRNGPLADSFNVARQSMQEDNKRAASISNALTTLKIKLER